MLTAHARHLGSGAFKWFVHDREIPDKAKLTPNNDNDKQPYGLDRPYCPGYYYSNIIRYSCSYQCSFCCAWDYMRVISKPNSYTPFTTSTKYSMFRFKAQKHFSFVGPHNKGKLAAIVIGKHGDPFALSEQVPEMIPRYADLVEIAESDFNDLNNTIIFWTRAADAAVDALAAAKKRFDDNHRMRNVIVSFSVNSPEVANLYEKGAPGVLDRINAALRLKRLGYRIRFVLSPIIPVPGSWSGYLSVLRACLAVRPELITFGHLMRTRLKRVAMKPFPQEYIDLTNEYCSAQELPDTWIVPEAKRVSTYLRLIERVPDDFTIGLCRETDAVYAALPRVKKRQCNCVVAKPRHRKYDLEGFDFKLLKRHNRG